MHRSKNKTIYAYHRAVKTFLRYSWTILLAIAAVAGATLIGLAAYEKQYQGKIYPPVTIDGIAFGGKTPQEVEAYWKSRSAPFADITFELRFEDQIATVSGTDLELGYDAQFSATQAYMVGRSGFFLRDLHTKLFKKDIALHPYLKWNHQLLDDTLGTLAEKINIPVEDALFSFASGKVTSFKPSRDGRQLNLTEAKRRFENAIVNLSDNWHDRIVINLPVDVIKPSIATDKVNAFGIKERIGRGYSEFSGSIPGRIHNVLLAASRINGILIKPGDVFSFNDAVGDISAATGYQSAYIIKEGRTVLGDGGGVCQVSTTLFRAALNAGLPIVERNAHAYRVHYYEEGGFKPGLDATVFAPSADLKIKNDTPGYILIQTKADAQNLTLAFDLYGTSDGRKAEIFNQLLYGITPPPPTLYQDDPTLPVGVEKQVDFSAWGAKASFQYKVTRGVEVLQDTTFFSNYRPWQAVYLRGTKQ